MRKATNSRKKQFVKNEDNPQSNPYMMLFPDATTGAQSIVVPNSPAPSPPDMSSNFNALLDLGQGVWPNTNQPIPSQTQNYLPNLTDLQNSFDMPTQLPLATVTRDGSASTANDKVPIKRLKPSNGSQTAANFQLQPSKQQKKVAHNAIERRYRNNINDRINDLKAVVPALCHLKSKDNKDEDDDEVDGIPAATKLNKATILRKATEYIIYLKKNNQQYKEENNTLKKMVESLPGGINLYAQYMRGRRSHIDSLSLNDASSSAASPRDSEASGPPTPPNDNTGSRVLMALFMCMTFFTSPSEYSQGDHLSHNHEGRAEGTTDSISRINSASSDVTIDLWYYARIITFLLCFTYILRPSIFSGRSSRNRKSKQSVGSAFTAKTKDAKSLYQLLSDHTFGDSITMLELIIGSCTELFKLFMRRFIGWDITGGFAIQECEDKMKEVGLWGRLGEVELCGGNKKASRFSILYTSLRTVNLLETTYAPRKHPSFSPSRIYANAALQFYIGFGSSPFIAERAASHFWKKAIFLKGRNGPEENWLQIALSSDQESDLWKSVANKIAKYALQSPKDSLDEEMKRTTVPLAHISDAQSLFHLKEAYLNFISVRYGKKKPKNVKSFVELVNVTTPSSLTHWYALVGCAIQAFSVGDNATGEKLVNRLKEGYSTNDDSNNRQIIGMGLLSYALLMYGKVEASTRCADKAGASIFRRNKEKPLSQNVVPNSQDYEIKKIEREIHDLAEFCSGWLVLEARVLGWKIIEEFVTDENKASTLPEVLSIDARLKPGVQGWLTYMRRLSKLDVFDNKSVVKACREFLKLLDTLSRFVGGVEELDEPNHGCEEQTETAESEKRAARAWRALKGIQKNR